MVPEEISFFRLQCNMSLPLSLFISLPFIPLLIFLLKSWESITSVRDYCTYMVFIIAQQTDYVGNYYCWTILEKLLLCVSECADFVLSILGAISGAIPIYVLPLLNCLFCIVLKSFSIEMLIFKFMGLWKFLFYWIESHWINEIWY